MQLVRQHINIFLSCKHVKSGLCSGLVSV